MSVVEPLCSMNLIVRLSVFFFFSRDFLCPRHFTSACQQTSESSPLFPLAHLHFFSTCHSTTLARCAEKALTALTTASRLRQNPQKRTPSGQTNRRGRQSETCAKKKKILPPQPLFFQGLHSSTQAAPNAH